MRLELFLQFAEPPHKIARVTSPLAILFYEDLIPGSQLVNRLQDQRYRVHVAGSPEELLSVAASAGPMLILADLVSKRTDVCALIQKLRTDAATAHVPVIGFADEAELDLQARGKAAGAALVVSDAAIIPHLNQFIERALQVE